jgi:hypothetical protein
VPQENTQGDETNSIVQVVISYEIKGVPGDEIPGVYGEAPQSTYGSTASASDNSDDEINYDDDAGNVETPDEEMYHPYTMAPSVQRIH